MSGFESGIALGNAFLQGKDRREGGKLFESLSKYDAPQLEPEFKRLLEIDPGKAKNLMAAAGVNEASRFSAMIKDAKMAKHFLSSGNIGAAQGLLEHRMQMVKELGGDSADTAEVYSDILNSNPEEALNKINSFLGLFDDGEKGRKTTTDNRTAQEKNFERRNEIVKSGDADQLAVFDKLINLTEDAKLSSRAEKAIIDAQDAFVFAGNSARKMEILANDVQRLDISGGLASTASETFKSLLGSQDDVSDLRRQFRGIRASQSVTNLPPGPASDKDIALALSGFPAENANAEQIVSFLKGAAKLQRIDEKYNEFKAEYIAKNNKVGGLIGAWKEKLNDEDFVNSIISPQDKIKEAISVNKLSDDELFN